MVDNNLLVAASSILVSVAALVFAILSARSSKKSKEERQSAVGQETRLAERIKAEEERISIGAAHMAVEMVEHQLERAKETIQTLEQKLTAEQVHRGEQDARIEKQSRIIRRQNVRLELQHEQILALRQAIVEGRKDVPPLPDIPDEDLWPNGGELE